MAIYFLPIFEVVYKLVYKLARWHQVPPEVFICGFCVNYEESTGIIFTCVTAHINTFKTHSKSSKYFGLLWH